jgi:hypothetical protein
MEYIVKLGALKSAINIRNSIDPAVSGLSNEETEKKLKRMANSLSINWRATSEDIENRRLRVSHIKQWAQLKNCNLKFFYPDKDLPRIIPPPSFPLFSLSI